MKKKKRTFSVKNHLCLPGERVMNWVQGEKLTLACFHLRRKTQRMWQVWKAHTRSNKSGPCQTTLQTLKGKETTRKKRKRRRRNRDRELRLTST